MEIEDRKRKEQDMNFELTKEQALLKKAAQQFAENILEPTAAELDETHVFPVENFKRMAR